MKEKPAHRVETVAGTGNINLEMSPMESIREIPAAVTPSRGAPGRGWIIGGYVLAAGLLMVALVLLGLLLSSAGGTSGRRGSGGGSSGVNAAVATARPGVAALQPTGAGARDQERAAALAAFRAAGGLPDISGCMDDLGKLESDRTLMTTQLQEGGFVYNSMRLDAQHMVTDCALTVPRFSAMDVGDDLLAQDARNHWHNAVLELMTRAQDYADGYADMQAGRYDAGIRLFGAGNDAMDAATADMRAGNQDLGLTSS